MNRIITGDCRDTDLAYCAGVIDSDGTIGVKRSTYAMRKRGDTNGPVYSERISVKQVQREAVDLLHTLFGGSRYVQDPSAKRGKPLYSWEVKDLKAAQCLASLLPYLLIKRQQAENCLALRTLKTQCIARNGGGRVGRLPRTEALLAAMESQYQQAKELNRVGA